MNTHEPTPAGSPEPSTENVALCPLCDTPLDPVHPDECPKCDWVRGYRHRSTEGTFRDRVAVALSVLPGLGHIYKGHQILGSFLMLGTFLAVCGAAIAATATALWGLLLLPLYWVAVMLHAYSLEDLAAPTRAHFA
jgi:hypothetical protein